jgi:dihydroorotate dehydrogenase
VLARLAFRFASPILARMDAEAAHRLTMSALKLAPVSKPAKSDPRLAQKLFGLEFPNPVGLAAGFDKNGEVIAAMLGLGFGFVEAGTVTPRPQEGNPKPRLFRLAEDRAVINRMGFNNQGHAALLDRLRRMSFNGIVGINIGANKDSADRIADYVAGLKAFADRASYITVNVSSPNTPGLRGLQSKAELHELLGKLNESKRSTPLLLKIAPDLDETSLEDIATCCKDGAVDGVIMSNTTISRPPLTSRYASEQGGLSGKPLFDLSTRQLARFYLITGGRIPLIGAGGISGARTAWTKIAAGASLLQLYTALVFKGPRLIRDINHGLAEAISESAFDTLAQAVGHDAQRIAHQGLSGT